MRFRPCIDIHNGKVKQIVGGSLDDKKEQAVTNFTSEYQADFYAELYKKDELKGGHIILLNKASSEYYEATREQAVKALHAYPQGMQIGGGITPDNARQYLREGASHVIVTSYVFQGGRILYENLKKLKKAVGKERIVLDLSCRKRMNHYYIVTDRWQTYTEEKLTRQMMEELSEYCDEFLVHGVDAEGKASGVELPLVEILASYEGNPVTYAGGIGCMADLEKFRLAGRERIDFTIGSALDLFGGKIPYNSISKL